MLIWILGIYGDMQALQPSFMQFVGWWDGTQPI